MNAVEIGHGMYITIVRDGAKKESGNFLGLYWIPPGGNREWYAANGDHGECDTDAEALKEIKDAWRR